MTERTRSLFGTLIRLAGLAVLIAAVVALLKGGAAETPEASGHPPPAATKASAYPELITYIVGYALALILTIVAFALVHWRWAPPSAALAIVFGLALVQIVVHFRCFLHVTLRGPARDDLQLILFSTMIIFLMVGGTLVILLNLRERMM